MYNETIVTLQGRVGTDVVLRQAAGATVANFRLACTPRRLNRQTGEWGDGPTQWYSVSTWRTLAEHCAASLHRGDAVIVHGRLDMRSYVNKSGVETLDISVDASSVGHDLTWGTSSYSRVQRQTPQAAGDAAGDPEAREQAA
jgi:single-strand DNA-binding protein